MVLNFKVEGADGFVDVTTHDLELVAFYICAHRMRMGSNVGTSFEPWYPELAN